jgi:hypothetical protein
VIHLDKYDACPTEEGVTIIKIVKILYFLVSKQKEVPTNQRT